MPEMFEWWSNLTLVQVDEFQLEVESPIAEKQVPEPDAITEGSNVEHNDKIADNLPETSERYKMHQEPAEKQLCPPETPHSPQSEPSDLTPLPCRILYLLLSGMLLRQLSVL